MIYNVFIFLKITFLYDYIHTAYIYFVAKTFSISDEFLYGYNNNEKKYMGVSFSLHSVVCFTVWTRKHKSVPTRSMARAVHTVHCPRFTDVTSVATLFATPHLYVYEISFPIPMDTNFQIERRWCARGSRAIVLLDAYKRGGRFSQQLYDLNSERESVWLRKRNTVLLQTWLRFE